ncbi:MAG TPA: hypothetical protein VM686_20385 [Polyangiaceae bacterium]|nr:hypothetical protein [Polyangiaceae bacterium]
MRPLSFLVCIALAFACSKKEPPKPRTEPWENPAFLTSASASAPAGSAAPGSSQRYVLTTSDIRFSLPAKEQTTHGKLSAASGELFVGQGNFSDARATLNVDLTSLSIEEEAGAGDHGAYTRRALEWLDLGEAQPPTARERYGQARFELSGLGRLSEGKRSGSWQATASGQLSLHGFRVPIEQPISFELSAEKVVIRSQRPLLVKLAEHDLKPRNAQGQLVSTELSLLGTRIGREARVDFELVFAAQPPAEKEQQE